MKYGLNDEQWNSIVSRSPVLINASAGSGKTRCLVAKIRYLLDSGTPPQNICAITFTNKAADEMKERLRKHHDIKEMQISTIHSMCVRIIKTFPQYTYLKLPFSIYDDGDQLSVVKTIIKSRNFSEDPYEVLSTISKAKSENSQDQLEGILKVIYKQYQEILKKNNACDFDDLLLFARDCLKQEDCRFYFTNRWLHILVDESQDTSQIQYEIILLLYDQTKNKTLFLIGDANQSIYSWRGARPKNIQDFIKEHNPTQCSLTYNYRSCPEIINHANSYLQFGSPMIAKSSNTGKVSVTVFNSQEEEAEKIAQALLQMGGYEDTAILYRMNSRSLLFERAFSIHRIPYKVVGDLPFYRRKVVKDLIAGLKASNNPQDTESLARIINNPKRGFGDAKKELLFLGGRPYVEDAANEMPAIKELIDLLNEIKGQRPLDALNEYLSRTGYRNTLTKDSDLNMVNALQDVVAGFDTVEDLILACTFLEKDSGRGVKLMTAHASKGLEFKRVFIVGIENEIWPHINSKDIDEEKRLFFVAITRAKSYLNISYSKSRFLRGKSTETRPSSFFLNIYDNLRSK